MSVIKISGHGDHSAGQFAAELRFCTLGKRLQNLSAHFHRAFVPLNRSDRHAAGRINDFVGQYGQCFEFAAASREQALGRIDGVARIALGMSKRIPTRFNRPILQVAHD